MLKLPDELACMRFSYAKLMKLIKKRRMTLSAFQKRTGMSDADIYLMQINQRMSFEGEFQACFFLKCDTSDILTIYSTDPNDPDFEYIENAPQDAFL